MKLSSRVRLTIVPIIVVIYSLLFLGVSYFQVKSYKKNVHAELALHIEEVKQGARLYFNFSQGFLSFLVSSSIFKKIIESPEVEVSAAFEEKLSNTVDEIIGVEYNSLELSIRSLDGEFSYTYMDGNDPFTKPSRQVARLYEEIRKGEVLDGPKVLVDQGNAYLIYPRVIDLYTEAAPLSDNKKNAYAVILFVDIKTLNDKLASLSESRSYEVLFTSNFSGGSKFEVIGDGLINEFSEIAVIWDNVNVAIIKKDNGVLILMAWMFVLLIFLVFTSSSLLVYMIERRVTQPIIGLGEEIKDVSNHGDKISFDKKGDEEIVELKKAFFSLFSNLNTAYQKIQETADVDALTGLVNRRKFNILIREIIRQRKEKGDVALLYVDLDNFKYVNDNYGHESGDVLLTSIGDKLKSIHCLNSNVVNVARLAGDEFALLVSGYSDLSEINAIAVEINSLFVDGFECSAGNFPVSSSIGIAVYPKDGENAEELIAAADGAMFQSKHSGKNRYSYFSSELAEKNRRSMLIESELKKKDFDGFYMNYMPILCASSKEIIGVEALVRWNSPVLGFVSPAEFIPLAESRGLFDEIDLWVIDKVLEERQHILDLFGEECKIYLNISSAQLNSSVFFFDLMKVFQRHGAKCKDFVLELTETFSSSMTKRVENNLRLFKYAGFTLALDDFGTGHTAMIQLIDYPIDIIKIDKSIIDRVGENNNKIIFSMIAFFKSQGFKVCAEGIESGEQVDLVTQAGVDTIQGFHFYKPDSVEGLQRLLNKERTVG